MDTKHLTITIYSHHFSCTKITPRGNQLCLWFAQQLVMYGYVPERGKLRRTPLKVFGSATLERCEFRFHINSLKKFEEHLRHHHCPKEMVNYIIEPMYVPEKVDLPVYPNWIPRDYQVPIIEYLANPLPVSKLVGIQTGQGKAQPLDALIKIPGGWSTMGDMAVGTEVIAKDGTITKVTGVFPQGQKEIFKITFSDGRVTECCADHLWRVYYVNTTKHKRWRIVNTLEVLRLISMPNPRVYIDLIDSEQNTDIKLPIDPYLLGVFLGDGSSRVITPTITTPDEFIINEITNLLPQGNKLTKSKNCKKGITSQNDCYTYGISRIDITTGINPFLKHLKDLNLFYKMSYDKFIPEIYLHASTQQRLHLLQGLLDTDGTIGKDGVVSFCSASEILSLGVQYLVRSLGGKAWISTRIPNYTYLGQKLQGRMAYQVNIQYKKQSELFRLPKKKERTNDNNQYSPTLKLKVISIKSIGFKEAQCISIDHPDHLYVTDQFIVTHNTLCSLLAISKIGLRTVIIIKPAFIEKWIDDFNKTFNIDKDDVLVIKGAAQLKALIVLANENRVTEKLIIISNKTFQSWMSLYEKYKDETLGMGYDIRPFEIFKVLKAGVRLIDEVHMAFHNCFKMDLYTHVPTSIALSATLVSEEPFIAEMHKLAYPLGDRYKDTPLTKYIESYAMLFRFNRIDLIKTTEYGSSNFSMNAVEKSIMKHIPTLNNYFKLIDFTIEGSFIKCTRSKKKLLIFASTVDMCTLIVNHLKHKYPQFDTRRYVADDEYTDLIESEVCVSTLGSAGTAIDLPNLTTVILTTMISSIQSNIQSLGRLRKLNDDHPVQFYYFVATDIPKSMEYHSKKKLLLSERAASFKEYHTGYVL